MPILMPSLEPLNAKRQCCHVAVDQSIGKPNVHSTNLTVHEESFQPLKGLLLL